MFHANRRLNQLWAGGRRAAGALALALGCSWTACAEERQLGYLPAEPPLYELVSGSSDCPPARRQTLMQWSYGTSFGGGAPLDEPLVSDRPDFTEASTTVGAGVLQLEMGYTFARDEEAGAVTEEDSFPEILLRAGLLADWLEFRFGYNAGRSALSQGLLSTGSRDADLYAGVKIALTPQEGILPEMAIVPQMLIPVQTDLPRHVLQPGVNWLYGWDLGERLSTGGSTQYNRRADEAGQAYGEVAQSWTVGYALTERLGMYTEAFALFPTAADDVKPEYYGNGGFQWMVSDNLALDVRGGVGLNTAAVDYFLGSGAVVRF